MINEIGFMQGRLVNSINNKIQAFPIKNWKKEFQISKKINIHLMEWTLDYNKLYSNPLMTSSGRKLIKYLKKKYNLKVESITCDSVMQKPFWRKKNYKLKNQLFDIAEAASILAIKYL